MVATGQALHDCGRCALWPELTMADPERRSDTRQSVGAALRRGWSEVSSPAEIEFTCRSHFSTPAQARYPHIPGI